jgi:hypothetical protein
MRSTILGLAFNPPEHAARPETGGAGGYTGAQGARAAGPAASRRTLSPTQILRRALMSKMPGQSDVSQQTLIDQMQTQQMKIEVLRKQLDAMIHGRCEEADLSASQCASAERAALPEEASPTLIGTTDLSVDESLVQVAVENRIQAQQEIISPLRQEIAECVPQS